jgi:hypothetical protein
MVFLEGILLAREELDRGVLYLHFSMFLVEIYYIVISIMLIDRADNTK